MICSGAAAAVHLAVTPHHLVEAFVVGTFFLVVTLLQAWWAWQVTRDASTRRLQTGVVLSLALILLWGLSRTSGLPLLGREQVGPWDVASKIFELVVLGACLAGLARPQEERSLAMSTDLNPVSKIVAGASAVVLVVLALSASVH